MNELNIFRTGFDGKGCKNEVKVFTNMKDFDEFQKSLIIPGQRNAPLEIIDFSNKNIAVICKEDIDRYEISELTSSSKKNILRLHQYKDEADRSINLFFIEIPKEINYLTLEY
ncbi:MULTISPECIES: hypothetical protein [Empedobacter]|uniref:hypothetical protein n=1 Tax=Empedobacter TaxID=59734 RepID=UPI000E802EA2|nr:MULTISPECIES: hypothetical protein [Empedobacter]MBY0067638.1 hypothetical protein [Empedobacter falsenii]MDH2205578.1 hypothetical protein [Empedobacter sp. GD03644]HBX62781.1 hypothetical protein [Flavobacteriaceae bacterium]